MKRIILVGFPELGEVLESPGVTVDVAPGGMALTQVVGQFLRAASKADTVLVVTDTGDPQLARHAANLAQAGYGVVVLTGFHGSSGAQFSVPSVSAPFTVNALRQLIVSMPQGIPFGPLAEDEEIGVDALASDSDYASEPIPAPERPVWNQTFESFEQPVPEAGGQAPPLVPPAVEDGPWAAQQQPERPVAPQHAPEPPPWAQQEPRSAPQPTPGPQPQQPQAPVPPPWAGGEQPAPQVPQQPQAPVPPPWAGGEQPTPQAPQAPPWANGQQQPDTRPAGWEQAPPEWEQPTEPTQPALPPASPTPSQGGASNPFGGDEAPPAWSEQPAPPPSRPEPPAPGGRSAWGGFGEEPDHQPTPSPAAHEPQPPAADNAPRQRPKWADPGPGDADLAPPVRSLSDGGETDHLLPDVPAHRPRKPEDGRTQVIVYTAPKGGTGKSVALDEPVPTPDGWKMFGDLVPGDEVFDERGEVCRVTALTETWTDLPCYRMTFSDGASIVTGGPHEWPVWYEPAKKNIVRTTEEVSRTLVKSERVVDLAESGGGKPVREFRHAVVNAGPLQLPEVDLPVSPYVLGVWLGDGDADGILTGCDAEVAREVEAEGYGFALVYEDRRKVTSTSRCSVLGFRTALGELGVLSDKHVPDVYLRASFKQRLSLLQGLMDSVGCVGEREVGCEFSNGNKRVVDGFVELARSLGLAPIGEEVGGVCDGEGCGPRWRVTFSVPDDVQPFRLPRKAGLVRPVQVQGLRRQIVGCEPVPCVPVRCIEVDSSSHLYLVGEAMVPTHNSSVSLTTASFLSQEMAKQGKSVVYVDANVQQADAGKYLRTINKSPTIVHLARRAQERRLDEAAVRDALVEHPEYGLFILHGPSTPAEADPDVITPQLYSEVVNLLRGMFDYVIVDTPVAEHFHSLFTDFVLRQADKVVVVVTPSHTTVWNTAAWLRTISDPVFAGGQDFRRDKVGVLLNQYQDGLDCDVDTVQSQLAGWPFLGVIPETKEWRRATNNGELLTTEATLVPVYAEVMYLVTGEPALADVAERRGSGVLAGKGGGLFSGFLRRRKG